MPKTKYKKKKKLEDGAVVYEYSEKQVQHRNREKAKRVEKLSGNIDKLRKDVKKNLSSKDDKDRLVALAVTLMDQTYERPGNEQSAKDNSHYGVTTWQVEHVNVNGSKMTFTYTGKSGVDHKKTIEDAAAAKVLKELLKDKKKGDKVFECGDTEKTCVRASDVNKYLKEFDITAKDLRGYHANRLMQEALKKEREKGGSLPSDAEDKEKALKKEFDAALETVAKEVGHEAATLRSNYLVPALESTYLSEAKVIDKLDKLKSARMAKDLTMAKRVARLITRSELEALGRGEQLFDEIPTEEGFRRVRTNPDLAKQVAASFMRKGGLFEAPPAMVKDVLDWAMAQVAANRIEDLKKDIEERKLRLKENNKLSEEANKALEAWKKDFKNYKKYKAFFEAATQFSMEIFHSKLSVRMFQKMDAEKEAALKEALAQQEESLKRDMRRYGMGQPIEELAAETFSDIEALKKYKAPGVKADDSGTVSKEFQIDLSGWKYGEAALFKAIDDHVDRDVKERMKQMGQHIRPEMFEEFEEMMRDAKKGFQRRKIKVSLQFKQMPVDKSLGSWNWQSYELDLKVPYGSKPWQLSASLSDVIEHELQHLGQTLMASAVGLFQSIWDTKRKPRPGLPSKNLMTPDFIQEYDRVRDRGEMTDELRAVLQKLKSQGVDTRGLRFHSLDDIEFYTLLADSIRDFKRAQQRAGRMDRKTLNNAIRRWTGEIYMGIYTKDLEPYGDPEVLKHFDRDKFFFTLSKVPSAKGKWKKAVSMLVKAVT